MKDVQCYELFGGIALKNHAFSFHFSLCDWQIVSSKACLVNTLIMRFYLLLYFVQTSLRKLNVYLLSYKFLKPVSKQ